MISDFASARHHLERARGYIRGNDDISRKARQALDVLIEVAARAERELPSATVLEFPGRKEANPDRAETARMRIDEASILCRAPGGAATGEQRGRTLLLPSSSSFRQRPLMFRNMLP